VIYPVVTATLIGLPYVQRLRGHVNVDLISSSLPLRARMALAIFTLLMSCLIVVVML
jgi:TRAP-type C4-dicarboxylate transport system permease small subunit